MPTTPRMNQTEPERSSKPAPQRPEPAPARLTIPSRKRINRSCMTSPIEQRFAKIVDLLDPIQIVALYLGLINLEELVRADLHPRKHNASGRASYLGDYHRILHRELVSGLAKRDPVKARRVAE